MLLVNSELDTRLPGKTLGMPFSVIFNHVCVHACACICVCVPSADMLSTHSEVRGLPWVSVLAFYLL